MKRLLLTTSIALLSIGLHAQVGINTESPTVTLDIASEPSAPPAKAQGVLFPRMTTAKRNQMQNVPIGTMIYNTTKNCIDYYDGTYWQCSDGTQKDFPNGVTAATATLGTIDPLRWIALEYNGTYSSFPENGIANNATITVSIPYSNATGGAYIAYEQTFTLLDRNSTPKDFKLSYPAGTLSTATGTITATLTNISGSTYEPQPQTPDGQWKNLANVAVTLNGTSNQPLAIQVLGGIPDRGFGKTTREYVGYGADELEHQFVYMPVRVTIGSYDKVWLSNNLGANYANIDSPNFNINQQATSRYDYKAYGSSFQWQRRADGHELISWSGATPTDGTPKYGKTSITTIMAPSWTNADMNEFIRGGPGTAWNWVRNGYLDTSGPNTELWRANGANNPCPKGYHVPTKAEWVAYHKAVTGSETELTNSTFWNDFNADLLRLPAANFRSINGEFGNYSVGNWGRYWSSSTEYSGGYYGKTFAFHGNNSNPNGYSSERADGNSCRCIQD